MKKQTFTRISPAYHGASMRTVFLKFSMLTLFIFSGLLAQSQTSTVTGGNCTGCDASMTVKFIDCNCVEISACKKLSNVVIRTANGAEIKYDNLSSKTASYCSTNGFPIVKVWVKAGCFQSGDGPGYGRKFDNPNSCNSAPPCSSQGGDTDGDGVCNTEDCQPNNPDFPAVPGTPCDDGDPNTINDVVQPGGCACAGTTQTPPNVVTGGQCTGCDASMTVKFISCYCVEISACKDLSNVVIRTENGVDKKFDGLSGKTGTFCSTNGLAITTVWVKAGCYQSGDGPGYGRKFVSPLNCTIPCAGQGGDTDNDGYCDSQDCRPNDPAFPATPGTPCNDGDPNTNNDKVTSDGCGCEGTPVVVCDNIALGGTIGFGPNCNAAVQYCPTSESAPTIEDCASPIGGSGPLEVVWLKSTTSCTYPTTTAAEIAQGLDPHWSMIPGATSLSYNPGNISEPTCFLRCVRRVGCSVFIESNIVSLGISPNCGGGNVADCSNIGISVGPGSIIVSGTDKAPITFIQVFNSLWQSEFSCYGDCQQPTANIPVPAGSYFVKVNYFNDAYELVCEENRTINVVSALQGSAVDAFQFAAIKHDEHTELLWSYMGNLIIKEYLLERSTNGVDFTQIDVLAGSGNSGKGLYESYDLEPVKGDNFYRVKMVDENGEAFFSKVAIVNFPDFAVYSLLPNPANGFVKLNLEKLIGYKDVTVTFFNTLGLEMKRVEIGEVYGKTLQLDIRDLQEGQYIVWVNAPGKRPVAKKLVVGRY